LTACGGVASIINPDSEVPAKYFNAYSHQDESSLLHILRLVYSHYREVYRKPQYLLYNRGIIWLHDFSVLYWYIVSVFAAILGPPDIGKKMHINWPPI